MEGHTILHCGRPVPREAQAADHNEGVGIVLDLHSTIAWRNAGETWKAVSYRIVTARLKIARQDEPRSGRRSSSSPSFVTVYAPTHKAIQEKEFYADVQATIDSVHVDEVLLLVGDFNAKVGSSERREYDSIWEGDESGEALLSFCALTELPIMNTCIEKNVYKYTWQHPGRKKWHCIDCDDGPVKGTTLAMHLIREGHKYFQCLETFVSGNCLLRDLKRSTFS